MSYSHKDTAKRFDALQSIVAELIRPIPPRELLTLLVKKAMELMNCEAASLYVKKSDTELVFEVAMNNVVPFNFERRIIPVTEKGFATYSFRTGDTLRIEDVYEIPEKAPYYFDDRFDRATGYRTRSVMVCPVVNSRGERLGVLQLINPIAEDGETAFRQEDETLIKSFAAVGASSIDNSNLYQSIQDLFEGLVRASVHTIESRDPATRGHSERVALLTVDLAEKVSRSQDAEIRSISFSERQLAELRYAALLHDFGKIVVREQTLLKAEKLLEHQKTNLRHRLNSFNAAREIHLLRGLFNRLEEEKRAPDSNDLTAVERELHTFRSRMETRWKQILELNKPTVLDEDKSKALLELRDLEFMTADRNIESLLTPQEIRALSVKRGSLTEDERKEIESHVTVTYLFLKEIPWSKDFADLPKIAYTHHEKLDGSGYPNQLKHHDIPVQARLMTICDIYDALVAADRPYKSAVPVPKALQILESEVNSGKLDARFFQVFLEARIFENPQFMGLVHGPRKKAA